MTRRRVPVMTHADRIGLAFLTSTHVVDDLYQGAVPALLPFLAIERHYSTPGLPASRWRPRSWPAWSSPDSAR
jgi:hypothetical protein